jgi:hypothetical protein
MSRRQKQAIVCASSILATARFPDLRLHHRAAMFLGQKLGRPRDSIPQGAGSPAAAKAAYRFIENPRVNAPMLWDPIHDYGASGLKDLRLVLSVQDTTALMFPTLEATTGLGTISHKKEEALLMHSALAVRPDGHVLGLLHNEVWARPIEQFGKAESRKTRSINEKESAKWLRGIEGVSELRDRLSPHTQLLHLFDREGDIHEVFQEVIDRGQEAVIRHSVDRNVDGEHETTRRTVAAEPVLKRLKLVVPRKKGQPKRTAKVVVRSTEVTLRPPKKHPGRRPLTLGIVWVHEPRPPKGVEALDWLLWTTLPVRTAQQCNRVVKYYKLRWRIEDFHKVLKSGCKIERTQLKSAARIQVLLALSCAVAVFLLQLTHWARTEPDAPCTLVLSDDQWRVLWEYTHKQPVPPGLCAPTMREAVRMIGRLGGHLGRKCDGMPGTKTLWLGWRDLQLLVEYAQIRT